MMKFVPIAPHSARLVRDCMPMHAVFLSKYDINFPGNREVFDALSPEMKVEILGAFKHGFLEVLVSWSNLPEGEGRTQYMITARKGEANEWYELNVNGTSRDRANKLIRQLANPLTKPYTFRDQGRNWLSLSFLCAVVGIIVIVGIIFSFPHVHPLAHLWMFICIASGVGSIISLLLYVPKNCWEARRRRVRDDLALLPQ